MRFGELLKTYRKAARMTQRDLGKAIGVTKDHVCRVENGSKPPSSRRLCEAIEKALGIPSGNLVQAAREQVASDAAEAALEAWERSTDRLPKHLWWEKNS